MAENIHASPSLFPHLPQQLAGLEPLAENLWWSWSPVTRMLFKTLDRQAWKESGHNPDKMLRELPLEISVMRRFSNDLLQLDHPC